MKHQIRKSMSDLRLNHTEVESKSRKIKKILFSIHEYVKAGTVMFYMSVKNEVETAEMIDEAQNTKRIVLPVTDIQLQTIRLSEWTGDFRIGEFNVPEPTPVNEVPASEIDLVIVPGVAFDRCGGRIGYGKGYYDKLLNSMDIPKIALAFSFQMLESVPKEEHDIMVDKIITEQGVIECDN